MKKSEIKIGKHYTAKVSDRMTTVRIDGTSPHGGWDATNIRTGKSVRIKSAQRLRHETRGPGQPASAKHMKAVHAADQENARLRDERKASQDDQTASERAMAQSATRPKKAKKAAKEPKAAAKRDTREPGGKGGGPSGKRLSGLDAAAKVLADAGEPLNTKDMVERMLAKGLWTTSGKTPAATIYAAIIREIATKGDDARFRKVDRGRFELAK